MNARGRPADPLGSGARRHHTERRRVITTNTEPRGERNAHGDVPGGPTRARRAEGPERLGEPERLERPERAERPGEPEQPERLERPGKPERLDTVVTGTHRTPIGELTLAASEQALLYCGFASVERLLPWLAPVARRGTSEREAGAGSAAAALLDRARAEIDDYLGGRRSRFEVPLDLRLATPFRREVVLGVERLAPYGATTTYGALAAGIGRPAAARAVGAALGANPLCVVLPCHRVLGASGKLTGYAGGARAKQVLLDLEAGR